MIGYIIDKVYAIYKTLLQIDYFKMQQIMQIGQQFGGMFLVIVEDTQQIMQ